MRNSAGDSLKFQEENRWFLFCGHQVIFKALAFDDDAGEMPVASPSR